MNTGNRHVGQIQKAVQIHERAGRMRKLRDIKIAQQQNLLTIAQVAYQNAIRTGGDHVKAYATLLQIENEQRAY